MDKTAGKLPGDKQLGPGFGGIAKAIAISLALHVLALLLPHPVLWVPLASISHHPGQPTAQWVTLPTVPSRAKNLAEPTVIHHYAHDPLRVSQEAATDKHNAFDHRPTDYRLTRDLTRPVELISDLGDAGDWPFDGTSGSALFRVIVANDGTARYVEVLASTLPPKMEAAAAWKLYKASYRPGEIGGAAVAAECFIEIRLTAAVDENGAGGR